jgi:hypothetical protein
MWKLSYGFSKTVLYIINRKNTWCLEILDLFLVLNMISHSFAALTREISCSTREINLVFPSIHVLILFSIYCKHVAEYRHSVCRNWNVLPGPFSEQRKLKTKYFMQPFNIIKKYLSLLLCKYRSYGKLSPVYCQF